METKNNIVGYNGQCPICGSIDGMIIEGKDGRFRNICRVINCPCGMLPAPAVGFDSKEDCGDPWETEYMKNANGTMTIGEYVKGKKEEG